MFKDDAYCRLSDLIFKGFLFLKMEFAGHKIIFKTVNEKEQGLIKLKYGSSDNLDYNIDFMIASLFMVDHENFLEKKEELYSKFFDLFSDIPYQLHKKIIEELGALKYNSYETFDFIEGFSFTEYSRRAWEVIGNSLPNKEEFTGVAGTEKIGLNLFQEYWIEINKVLDEEERYNKDFSLAILIASASNSKGARLTRARHDADVQNAKEKRQKIAQEGTSRKKIDWSQQGWAAPVDTAEELVAELERQMSGLKDRHDRFIEDYMKQLSDDAENRAQAEKQRLEEVRKKNADMLPISGMQRVLTPQESQELMKKKPNNLVIVKSDELASEEEKSRFLSKIGSKILTPRN